MLKKVEHSAVRDEAPTSSIEALDACKSFSKSSEVNLLEET
jgi:hypothetical protein